MARTFSLKTLGCKLNQYETARLAEALVRQGWVARPFGERVDAVIVNTCTVTDRADKKSRNLIRRGSRTCSSGKAVVTGCLVDRDRQGVASMPEVMAQFGNREKPLLAHRLAELVGVEQSPAPAEPTLLSPFARTGGYLKIQDGCDGWCSYCVVPAVRGAPRSERADRVLQRARRLVDAGCPELVLTGITIGRYWDGGLDLAGLAESIASLPGKFRLRFTSIEPTQVTKRLIDLLGHEKVCSHLHLPLQSGSDRILASMRRPYRFTDYRALLERVRMRYPDAAIGTDLMVGYPGETDDDFSFTLDAVEAIGFAYLHQFTYSSRPGTAAAAADSLPPCRPATAARVEALRRLGVEKSRDFARRLVGRHLTCVIERDIKSGKRVAVSDGYLKIALLPSPLDALGEGRLSTVELLDASRQPATGRLVASA